MNQAPQPNEPVLATRYPPPAASRAGAKRSRARGDRYWPAGASYLPRSGGGGRSRGAGVGSWMGYFFIMAWNSLTCLP